MKWKFSHRRARTDALRAICQVTEVEPAPATSTKTETVEDIIRKLLPALPPPQAVPIPSDRDVLIQQLMEAICPPTPVPQERSAATDLETLLLNWLPVEQSRRRTLLRRIRQQIPPRGVFRAGV